MKRLDAVPLGPTLHDLSANNRLRVIPVSSLELLNS